MLDSDFSANAKGLMESPLFSFGSHEGEIGWSAYMIDMWLRCECKCVYCGRNMLETYIVHEFDAQCDHLLPQGEYPDLRNEPSNWVLACSACNKLKGTWDANTYREIRYVKGTGKPLSRQDQKELIGRVIEANEAYSRVYEETFATQKAILLGLVASAAAGVEQAKAAHS